MKFRLAGKLSVGVAGGALLAATLGMISAGPALADPEGATFDYTATDTNVDTGSIILGKDDTVFAAGTLGRPGAAVVVSFGALDDTAGAVVTENPLIDAAGFHPNGVAIGPDTGPFRDAIFVSSDNDPNGYCEDQRSPIAQSKIQAYTSDSWSLIQSWTLPPGKCPASMAVGPGGNLWFNQVYANEVGRLNLDDSSIQFISFPGTATPTALGTIAFAPDGYMYFPAAGAYSLLRVGTGTQGTVLDDSELIPLSENPVDPNSRVAANDLLLTEQGDIWLPLTTGGSTARTGSVLVYSTTDDTFIGRSARLGADAQWRASAIAQTADGNIWVSGADFTNPGSTYFALSPFFDPESDPSVINIASHQDFAVATGPRFGGYIVAGPDGQGTLYRSSASNYVQRVGVEVGAYVLTASPAAGPAGTRLAITGTGLTSVTAVTVGGSAAVIDDSTATSLTVTVPAGSGTVDVVVTDPTGPTTLSNAFTYTNQIVLNSDGGTAVNGSDGLRLVVNYSGRPSSPLNASGSTGGEQVLWSGASMFYLPLNAGGNVVPSVWIGDNSTVGKLYGNGVGYTSCSQCDTWDKFEIVSYDAVGPDQSATLRYTALFPSTGGDAFDDTYVMTRSIAYSDDTPDSYRETWNFDFELSSPTDDTEVVKFYTAGDTAPGGSDQGFGVEGFDSANGQRTIVSANPTATVGTQVGYRTLTDSELHYKDFDGAIAVALGAGWAAKIRTGGNIGFEVQESTHDASMAIQWNIPPAGGTFAFDTFVSRYRSLTSSAFSPSTIGGDDTSVMTLTLSNTSFELASGLGFDVQLPSQLVLADGTVTTTCTGGTASGTVGGDSVTLSGASLVARTLDDSTVRDCTVTAVVRPQAAGTFTLEAGDVASTAGNLTNLIVPRSLTVTSTPTPPTPPTPPVTNPPSAPRDVTATAGDASATVSWREPLDQGSFPVTDYEVRSSPSGGSCITLAPQLSCEVPGLTNGVEYTFEVRALNGAGWSPWSVASEPVTPVGPTPPPERSIVIVGSRGEGPQAGRVFVDGSTTNLVGQMLQARVHLSGEIEYYDGSKRTVGSDGAFTWQRRANKKVYVYFRTLDNEVRSNRVIIRPA